MNGRRTSIVCDLEFQARALCSQQTDNAGNKTVRFYTATQNRRPHNRLHSFVLNEDRFVLETQLFSHPDGDICNLRASPHDGRVLAACYRLQQGGRGEVMHAAIIKLPEYKPSAAGSKETLNYESLEVINTESIGSEVTTTEFHPTDAQILASIINGKIMIFQRTEAQTRLTLEVNTKKKLYFSGGKWSQHQDDNQFIALFENRIKAYDIREPVHCAWKIVDSEDLRVRDVDCNLKKQYRIVTGYDDGTIKVWDTRRIKESLFSRNDHTGNVWSVRYNQSHDQLLLSSGDDHRVLLTCADSVSSESEATNFLEGGRLKELKEHLADGLLHTFSQHEQPVHCAEWSTADPWTFASLSCDGRFILSRVPKQFKYRILI